MNPSGAFQWACASTGGVFDTYAVVQGIDRFIPVDMYVPGCPPRPEQLIQAIIDLQDKIQREGTINGREFNTQNRQATKRALIGDFEGVSLDASRILIQRRFIDRTLGNQPVFGTGEIV